ncbi:hypothetical protein, partial [Bernardetia sp.]|uniref:hypothetical protein n=1 Tax=Bernardetia sp. TaxID=1937974 RepID=UPI0025BC720B
SASIIAFSFSSCIDEVVEETQRAADIKQTEITTRNSANPIGIEYPVDPIDMTEYEQRAAGIWNMNALDPEAIDYILELEKDGTFLIAPNEPFTRGAVTGLWYMSSDTEGRMFLHLSDFQKYEIKSFSDNEIEIEGDSNTYILTRTSSTNLDEPIKGN